MFIANTGIGLLSQYGDNAQRCKATQCYDWPWQKTGLYCFFSLVNNYIFVDYISLLSLSLLLSLGLLFPSLFSFMLWFKSCANNYLSSVFLYVFFFSFSSVSSVTIDRLGLSRVLPSWTRIQCSSGFQIFQRTWITGWPSSMYRECLLLVFRIPAILNSVQVSFTLTFH